MPVEVHQQEGQIVERVDGGDGLVELDGVEQQGPAAPQHDVAEVQVAVAAAHVAAARAFVENCRRRGRAATWAACAKPSTSAASNTFRRASDSDSVVASCPICAAPSAVAAAAALRWLSSTVSATARAKLGSDTLCRGDVAEQRRLIEAAHVHRPLDRLAAAAQREASVGVRA